MNTTAQALVFAVIAVASAASIGMGLADRMHNSSSTTTQEIVKLERVVIVGKRATVAQLPRVVVIGHRNTQQPADTMLAASCASQVSC